MISNQQYALKIVAKSTLVKPKSKQKVCRTKCFMQLLSISFVISCPHIEGSFTVVLQNDKTI